MDEQRTTQLLLALETLEKTSSELSNLTPDQLFWLGFQDGLELEKDAIDLTKVKQFGIKLYKDITRNPLQTTGKKVIRKATSKGGDIKVTKVYDAASNTFKDVA